MLVLLAMVSCTNDQKETIGTADKKELIGMWQDSPEIASGYTDYYKFFENGDFSFNYNEMECDKTTVDYSGTWELISNSELKLTIKKKRVIEGGKLVPTEGAGSCASEFYIEGGEIKTIELNDYEIQNVSLSLTMDDKEKADLKTRTFNERRFWKLGDDPASY